MIRMCFWEGALIGEWDLGRQERQERMGRGDQTYGGRWTFGGEHAIVHKIIEL